jgi:hypothetical protein
VDAGTRRLFLVVLVVLVAVAGGAALLLGGAGTADPPPSGTSQATGVIVAVDSAGLDDVRGLTLRTDRGDLLEFSLERLQNGDEFPPGHLVEHQATAEPVRIRYVEREGIRLALRIDDATVAPPS